MWCKFIVTNSPDNQLLPVVLVVVGAGVLMPSLTIL